MNGAHRAVCEFQGDRGGVARGACHEAAIELGDWRGGQKAQQINEVTSLADDAAAAGLRVLRPVICWDCARVDGHDEGFWCGDGIEQLFNFLNVGREAAVEADHQNRLPRPLRGLAMTFYFF